MIILLNIIVIHHMTIVMCLFINQERNKIKLRKINKRKGKSKLNIRV